MKISVAICTFNGGNFLLKQLESILNQTIKVDEIIISDDGSSDNTVEIISQFVESNPIIKFFSNFENIGYVKNFENTILKCTNEIIILCDQDDIWKYNKVEIIRNYFIANQSKSVVFTNANLIDEYDIQISSNLFEVAHFNPNQIKSINHLRTYLLGHYIATGATMAFKRTFFYRIRPIPKSIFFIHDSWIATVAACNLELGMIIEKTTNYRIHANNAIGVKINSESKSDVSKFDFLISIIERNKTFSADLIVHSRNVLSEHNYNYLLKRQVLLENLLTNNQTFLLRLKKFSFSYLKLRVNEFETMRFFIRNWIVYIFKF